MQSNCLIPGTSADSGLILVTSRLVLMSVAVYWWYFTKLCLHLGLLLLIFAQVEHVTETLAE